MFSNRPLGQSPEDDLLLRVQGIVAEYERAKIMERSRRGKKHAVIEPALNRTVHGQLDQNRSRARMGVRRPGYLLQELLACSECRSRITAKQCARKGQAAVSEILFTTAVPARMAIVWAESGAATIHKSPTNSSNRRSGPKSAGP